jgi:DUF1707 SHOCT-like domain
MGMSDRDPDQAPEAGQPSIESARETAIARLGQGATGGSLTLDEYAGRVAALEQAVTVEELDGALSGLPEDTSVAPTASHHRWLVAAFGGTAQRGRWRLSKHLWIVALLGGATLDLGAAELEAPESVITVFVALGGVDILAPPGVTIQLSGLSLFGGKSDKRPEAPPLPGSPLIHVRAFAIFGGVGVKGRNGT